MNDNSMPDEGPTREARLTLAAAILRGSVSLLYGASRLFALYRGDGLEHGAEVQPLSDAVLDANDLPISPAVRALWAPDALREHDEAIAAVENTWREPIRATCMRIVKRAAGLP